MRLLISVAGDTYGRKSVKTLLQVALQAITEPVTYVVFDADPRTGLVIKAQLRNATRYTGRMLQYRNKTRGRHLIAETTPDFIIVFCGNAQYTLDLVACARDMNIPVIAY